MLVPSLALALALSACGDDDGPRPFDAGGDAAADAAVDAGPVDTEPPEVVETTPPDGAGGVPVGTAITVTFTEAMNTEVGEITLTPGDLSFPANLGRWIDDDTKLVFTGVGGLSEGVEYTATASTGFEDAAGNALPEAYVWAFTTEDTVRPEVTTATPEEGATDVSTTLESVTVTFSEPMDPTRGAGILSGGRALLGEPSWNVDDTELTWPIEGLEADSIYSLSLEGFTDRSGNTLDTGPYLVDGFLDFETGPDSAAPVVVVSDPPEAGSGVDAYRSTIVVEFSEPMDPSIVQADLSDGTTTTTLTGSWSPDFTILTFDIEGLLAFDTTYSLDFGAYGYQDLASNALDGTSYLGDGALDFDTGPEDPGPIALASDPREGATDTSIRITPIAVQFNEPMDTSITTADLTDGSIVVTLTGSWTASDTIIRFAVPSDLLDTSTDYSLDLTGFQDAGGDLLNDTHPYLGDGWLDFRTQPPSGDNCRVPLTEDEAISRGGRLSWLVSEARRRDDGGTDSCDPDSTGAGQDLVIRYEKTTADLAGGGRLLHIFASSGDDLNIEVRQNTCAPGDDADQLKCEHDFSNRDVYLDVGPGTYYIWVAGDTTSDFGTTVEVEELPGWPEGESCVAPYTESSAIHTGGGMVGRPHIWEIPATAINAFDRAASTNEGQTSCNTGQLGSDAVVAVEKTLDDSVLMVTVTATDDSFSVSDLDIEISAECDPSAGSTIYACESNTDDPFTTLVGGAAGTRYIWLASTDTDDPFPGATVEVTEVAAAEGESCTTARAIAAAGTTAVTLDSTQSLGTPSCFDAAGNVTWYSYTPTEELVIVGADAAGGLAVVDGTTNEEAGCLLDASARSTGIRVPAGEPVCIALENGSSIGNLTVADVAYTGVQGTVTDLNVSRALSSSGSELSWTSDEWIAVTPTSIYFAEFDAVYQMPRSGGVRAVEVPGVTSSELGECGLAVGEEVFSIDDTSTSSSNRWYQLWDGSSWPWSPVAWDTSFTYGSSPFEACGEAAGTFVYAEDNFSNADIHTLSSAAPGAATFLGNNTNLEYVRGIDMDDEYIYFVAERDDISTDEDEGVLRVSRTDPTGAITTLAPFEVSTFTDYPLFVDDPVDPTFLYYRNDGLVYAIYEPDSASPIPIGPVVRLGTTSDYAMGFDDDTDEIFLFETETDSTGRIVRVE